jgi:hypothetical protein
MAEILSENGRLEGEGDELMRLVIVVSYGESQLLVVVEW